MFDGWESDDNNEFMFPSITTYHLNREENIVKYITYLALVRYWRYYPIETYSNLYSFLIKINP